MTPQNPADFYKIRSWLLLLLGISYSSYYFSRYNWPAIHQAAHESLGLSYSDFAHITSTALLVYGISVVFLGYLCDKYGGKALLKLGMAGAFVCNIVFGSLYYFSHSISKETLVSVMTLMWGCNYFFQSCGAVAVIKINAAWYHTSERAAMSGRFGFFIQFGRCLVLIACPIILGFLPWSYCFYIPSILLAIMYYMTRHIADSPEDIGFPRIEEEHKHIDLKTILTKVLSSRTIILTAILVFCIASVRSGIEHFASRFFSGQYHVEAALLRNFAPYWIYSIFMPASMMASSLFASFLCIRFFENRRFPVVTVSLSLCLFFICGLICFISNPYLAAICLIGIMFAMQISTSTVMGMILYDISGRNAAASLAGVFDGLGYIGSSILATIIGRTLDHYKGHNEWTYWPLVLIPPVLLGIGLSVYNRKYKKE